MSSMEKGTRTLKRWKERFVPKHMLIETHSNAQDFVPLPFKDIYLLIRQSTETRFEAFEAFEGRRRCGRRCSAKISRSLVAVWCRRKQGSSLELWYLE